MEAQAEMKGCTVSVSASVAGVKQAFKSLYKEYTLHLLIFNNQYTCNQLRRRDPLIWEPSRGRVSLNLGILFKVLLTTHRNLVLVLSNSKPTSE